jgi:cephalosporin hydroxylase
MIFCHKGKTRSDANDSSKEIQRRYFVSERQIQDDSQSDYHQIKAEAAASMRRGVWTDRFDERFVLLSEREMRSDIPREAIRAISEGKHFISYRGIPMAKDPFDKLLYETLFFELQPRTIIELGAYTGASALWMADTLQTYELDANVYSVDIDLGLVDSAVQNHPHVTFIQGDCNNIAAVFPPQMLADLPHPLVLIDDAHVNIEGVYKYFHQHGFQTDDYLIVEDTIPWIPGTFGKSDSDAEWGDWKWREIRGFFEAHKGEYFVDRYYTDFFGYNATWNWNGFFRRT